MTYYNSNTTSIIKRLYLLQERIIIYRKVGFTSLHNTIISSMQIDSSSVRETIGLKWEKILEWL